MFRFFARLAGTALATASLLLATPVSSAAPPSDAPAQLTIAYQPGLSYATLVIMREKRVLEKRFPNTKIDWAVLNSTAAIREGFIANQIQIGAGSTPPFLTGWDRGVGWKLLASLNEMDLWLVAKDPAIKSLANIKPDMKIGMPSPDSVQGLTLREAAQQQLGNAHALDQSIVSIDHPSGISALLNGQLAAHLTSPPFQYQEVAAGAHVVLRSFAILGQHTFNSVYVSESFAAAHPEFIKGVYRELVDATDLIKRHPAEAAAILSRDANGKVPASDFEKWLRRGDVNFTTTPHGFLRFASIMKSIDAIKKVPSSMRDIEVMSVLNGAGD